MVTGIESSSTSRALRLLAKQIEEGTQPDFFLVIMDDAGSNSTYKDVSNTYNLLGAVETCKMDLIYGD